MERVEGPVEVEDEETREDICEDKSEGMEDKLRKLALDRIDNTSGSRRDWTNM